MVYERIWQAMERYEKRTHEKWLFGKKQKIMISK